MTNRISIDGRLGADAELKFTNSGRPVLNFSVGDGKSRRTDNGEWEEQRPTIWHRVAVWGALAEMWANSGLLVKGAQVEITGEQTIREYEHNGEQRWSSEITAYQVGVRENRNQGGQGGYQGGQQQYQQPTQAQAENPWAAQVPGAGGFGDAYNAGRPPF